MGEDARRRSGWTEMGMAAVAGEMGGRRGEGGVWIGARFFFLLLTMASFH